MGPSTRPTMTRYRNAAPALTTVATSMWGVPEPRRERAGFEVGEWPVMGIAGWRGSGW